MIDVKIVEKVITCAVDIQQIPAPTFNEESRGAYLYQQFVKGKLADINTDELGNVYGRIPGSNSNHPIVVTAHLDTVFPYGTDLHVVQTPERIAGPGIGDNSLGLAGLLGLVWLAKEGYKFINDVWVVANVGEEGLGDLRGMKSVVERFGNNPKAYIIVEGMALGSIYHRGLCVRRYRIKTHTQGGHSWVNFGRPSAIHELARFITQLERLEVPASPRSSFNVGIIRGGTSVNTIAAEAEIEVDLRSESKPVLMNLSAQLEKLIQHEKNANGQLVEYEYEIIGDRPSGEISPHHDLVKLAIFALEKLDITPHIEIGSTDANIPLSKGYPAVCIGITTGSNAHTLGEYIETRFVHKGLTQLVDLVKSVDRSL